MQLYATTLKLVVMNVMLFIERLAELVSSWRQLVGHTDAELSYMYYCRVLIHHARRARQILTFAGSISCGAVITIFAFLALEGMKCIYTDEASSIIKLGCLEVHIHSEYALISARFIYSSRSVHGNDSLLSSTSHMKPCLKHHE